MPPIVARRGLLLALLGVHVGSARAEGISKSAAVGLAERFIARNGYTDLPRDQISKSLDPESLEFGSDREQALRLRFNTLKPKAVGVKKGARGEAVGWSVAFDYVGGGPNSRTCRVVTMNDDGTGLMVQHMDGMRSNFQGFD